MQPLSYQLHVPVRRQPSGLRFLLEGVKHIHGPCVPHGINGSECIVAIVLDDFHNPCPAEATERLRVAVLAAWLRDIQGIAHVILYRIGELDKSLRLDPTQITGFRGGSLVIGGHIVISLYHAAGNRCRRPRRFRGFVVHGSDGLEEITTTGPTLAYEIRDGNLEARTLEPRDFGVPTADSRDLKGGGKERNLEIGQSVLAGDPGPCSDIVLVNAAAALVAADRAETFLAAMPIAALSLDSGAARRKVEALARFTRELVI